MLLYMHCLSKKHQNMPRQERTKSGTDIYHLILRDNTPLLWKFNGGYVELNANGTPTSWNYYVTDHLGSTRMVVDGNDSIKEVINYYPFGAVYSDAGTADALQRYKYNGKELDRMHGLNQYDYGARNYDPLMCRFTQMDPLAENYYNVSPYAYCANNPVMFIDEHGDSLTLSGKQEDINSTLSVYNQGLGGYYQVSTDKNGLVILNANKNADPANMTDKEIQVYKELKRIIDSEYMTTINILNNSSEVTIGYAPTATIDIWDINAMSGLENSSPIAALMHETNEQSFIQDPNWHPNDANRVHKAHFSAEGLERMYTGNFGVTNWITTDGYVEFLRDNRVIERKKIW